MDFATKPSATLIIAVYNNTRFLELILLSLKNQSVQNFEIIISDDGSGPDIAKVIEKYNSFNYPIQHIWHEDKGFRKTVIANLSIKSSKSDYLVFIDGDCLLHHNFMKNHIKYKNENIVLVGRRVMLDKEITEKIVCQDVISKRFEKYSFWKKHCDFKSARHAFEIPFSYTLENMLSKDRKGILGCNFSLHKILLLNINGYNEEIIGRGIEDNNLDARLQLTGLKYKSVVRKAVQFHLFHPYKPVPHSKKFIEKYCSPKNSWAVNGIMKN